MQTCWPSAASCGTIALAFQLASSTSRPSSIPELVTATEQLASYLSELSTRYQVASWWPEGEDWTNVLNSLMEGVNTTKLLEK